MAMFTNPAVILYDTAGNALAVENGVAIPANTSGLIVSGNEAGTARFIDVVDTSGVKRLAVDVIGAATIAGSVSTSTVVIPSDPSKIVKDTLQDGGSSNMLVDGSSTPVEFSFDADPTSDIALSELRIVLTANSIPFNGSSFGPISTLTNGILVSVRAQSVTTQIGAAMKINEELLALVSPQGVFFNDTGPATVMSTGLSFGGNVVLDSGSADFVKITIQDDLTSALFDHFQATIWGTKP